MIYTNKGETRANGSVHEILADVSIIIDAVHESLTEEIGAEDAKDCIMKSVEAGFMSEDELQTKKKECINLVASELTEALDELKELIMKGMTKDGSK